jgi:TnpA family transposase
LPQEENRVGFRDLLTDHERTLLFEIPPDDHELIRHYTLSRADQKFVLAKRGDRNKLGVALQLGLLRHPGFGWRPGAPIPETLIRFIALQLGIPTSVIKDYGRRSQTQTDHARELATWLGLRHSSRGDIPLMREAAADAAWSTDQGCVIARAIIDCLRDSGIILPDPSVIERAGISGRAKARRLAAETLTATLTADQIKMIDALLVVDPATKRTSLAWLRDVRTSPTANNMLGVIERLRHVRSIGIDPAIAAKIHEWRFQQLVREGSLTPAFLLEQLGPRRRRASLVAQMIETEAALADAAITMFNTLIGTLFTRAGCRQERRYQTTARDVSKLMRLFHRTITAIEEAEATGGDALKLIEEQAGLDSLKAASPQVEELADLAGDDALVVAAEKYATIRKFVPAFLDAFTFHAAKPNDPVLSAIKLLGDLNHSGKRDLPAKIPKGFLTRAQSRLIMENGKPDRRLYETAAMAALRTQLRAGGIWVEGTRHYRRFDEYLLPRDHVPDHLVEIGLPADVDAYFEQRGKELNDRLNRFAQALKSGKVVGVALQKGKLHITPLKAATPSEAIALGTRLDNLMPRVRITELFSEVNQRTGFLSAFTDVRDNRPADNNAALYAAILANATNLGLERMADASQGVTYSQIYWANNWCMRDVTYDSALATVIDAHHALPFSKAWGAGVTSSSDGQFFRAGHRPAALSDINAKYGDDPGVKFYTHVSDQYGAYRIVVINATASEAPYVLDGLLHHGSGLDIQEHYVDTGGSTDPGFALCALLGYRFCPRLRDFGDLKLAIFRDTLVPLDLADIVGKPVREQVVRDQWPEVLRIGASLEAKIVAPSVILKKLSAYKQQNQLYLALQEIGRIERTLFMLDWLESIELRRRCNIGLNKGEAMHTLANSIFVHKQGRILDRSFENQSCRASALNLVVGAIVYWNTLYLDCAVETLRGRGENIPDHLLAHVSPLSWCHIGLTGDYLWQTASTTINGFRPLNDPRARFQLVG